MVSLDNWEGFPTHPWIKHCINQSISVCGATIMMSRTSAMWCYVQWQWYGCWCYCCTRATMHEAFGSCWHLIWWWPGPTINLALCKKTSAQSQTACLDFKIMAFIFMNACWSSWTGFNVEQDLKSVDCCVQFYCDVFCQAVAATVENCGFTMTVLQLGLFFVFCS